jgi:hypothetical protein
VQDGFSALAILFGVSHALSMQNIAANGVTSLFFPSRDAGNRLGTRGALWPNKALMLSKIHLASDAGSPAGK